MARQAVARGLHRARTPDVDRGGGAAGAPGGSVSAARERPAGAFDRKLVAPLILGAILNPINSSMIAVALVPIGIAFGAPPAETAWLVGGLYVATAIGQPVVGRLVDGYGPRRLFLVGTALVGLAGVVGVLSPQLWVLVVARVLLGFGTCAGYPAAMYLIRSEADAHRAGEPGGHPHAAWPSRRRRSRWSGRRSAGCSSASRAGLRCSRSTSPSPCWAWCWVRCGCRAPRGPGRSRRWICPGSPCSPPCSSRCCCS